MIIIAGIPDIYFEKFHAAAIKQMPGINFTGLPLRSNKGTYEIDENYCRQLIETAVRFLEGRKDAVLDGLGVIILKKKWEIRNFVDEFFPFALVESLVVDTPLVTKGQAKNQSANKYAEIAIYAARHLHIRLREITNYLRDQIKRTPALLPIRNFNSKVLSASLQHAHDALAKKGPVESLIEQAMAQVLLAHPRRRDGKGFIFEDDAKIEFKSPPRALFHGSAPSTSAQNGHKLQCFLTAKLRLGGYYCDGFHYDCTKGSSPLSATLCNCHGISGPYKGKPHLNIYPNDFVR